MHELLRPTGCRENHAYSCRDDKLKVTRTGKYQEDIYGREEVIAEPMKDFTLVTESRL